MPIKKNQKKPKKMDKLSKKVAICAIAMALLYVGVSPVIATPSWATAVIYAVEFLSEASSLEFSVACGADKYDSSNPANPPYHDYASETEPWPYIWQDCDVNAGSGIYELYGGVKAPGQQSQRGKSYNCVHGHAKAYIYVLTGGYTLTCYN